jgi:hypothetical protein
MTLDPEAVKKFRGHISSGNCDALMKMIDDDNQPVELILQADPEWFPYENMQFDWTEYTALHLAVKKNSMELVARLLRKRRDIIDYGSSDLAAHVRAFPFKVWQEYGLSAIDMDLVVGNEELLVHFKDLIDALFRWPNSRNVSNRLSKVEQRNKTLGIQEQLKSLLNETPDCTTSGNSGAEALDYYGFKTTDPEFCLHLAATNSDIDYAYGSGNIAVPVDCAFLKRVCEQIGDPSLLTPLLVLRDH